MSKYNKTIRGKSSHGFVSVTVDVYDVLKAFNVTCPALQHAVKKLLMPGLRGDKNAVQDMQEAIQAINRAIELAQAFDNMPFASGDDIMGEKSPEAVASYQFERTISTEAEFQKGGKRSGEIVCCKGGEYVVTTYWEWTHGQGWVRL